MGPGRGLRGRARLLPGQHGRLPGTGLRAHRLPRAPPPRRRPPPPAETSELQPEPGLACEPWEPRCHRPSLSGPRGRPRICPQSPALLRTPYRRQQVTQTEIFTTFLLNITTAPGQGSGAVRAGALGRRVSARPRTGRRGRHTLGHGKGWACTKWRGGLRTVPRQRVGKPILGCMPEEKAHSSRSGRRSEAAGSRSQPWGGEGEAAASWGRWLGSALGKGRASSENGVKQRRGRVRRGKGAKPRLCGVGSGRRSRRWPSQLGPRAPTVALVGAVGGWGFSLCFQPLCLGPGRPLSPLLRDPRPCLCRSALRPCPATSALARPRPLWSMPWSSRAGAARQAAGQMGGRAAQGGQSRAGGLPSGLPEQQDHQCPWPG